MEPTLEKQMQLHNEFNEKVAWTAQQFLNEEIFTDVKSKLKSELKENEGLLTPADSVDIMNQATIEFAKQVAKKRKICNQQYLLGEPLQVVKKRKIVSQPYSMDNSFLILSQAHMKENVIPCTYSDFQNASVSPVVEKSISSQSNLKP